MTDAREPTGLYESPENAIDLLLSHKRIVGPILEPSAGLGRLVIPLRRHGFDVLARDLFHHGASSYLGIETPVDFITTTTIEFREIGINTIVMNPDYNVSDEHVRFALTLVGNTRRQSSCVCVLLRLNWIAAKKRKDLLHHLERIIITGRMKMLPPNVADRGHGGSVDYAWFVFVPRMVEGTIIVRA